MTSILDQAKSVRADRAARVDDPKGNFARVAKFWEVVFGHEVTQRQVALAMMGLKLARECHSHWPDNLIDLAGYADCLAEIEGYYATESTTEQTADRSADRENVCREREDAAGLQGAAGQRDRDWGASIGGWTHPHIHT